MFATINEADQKTDVVEAEPIEKTQNKVIEMLQNDEFFQKNINALNDSDRVNTELANEILALLREIENPLYEESDGDRYINLETAHVPYNVLRRAGETEPARLIINKRRLDLSEFGKVAQDRAITKGAKLVFSNGDYTPTKEEKFELREWERKIFNNLFFPNNSPNPNFSLFLGNAFEDFFILDDITVEMRKNSFGRILGLHIQDPVIYKPVIKPQKYSNLNIYKDDITDLINDYDKMFDSESLPIPEKEIPDYLLVYQNQRLAGVTRERVRKYHYFLRSDFKKAQRGFSIVEQGIRMITHIVNAITMNSSNFTNNRTPQGFFAFTGGGVNQIQLERLKKLFYAYSSGAGNSNRFPMISLTGEKTDVKWVGTRGSSKDLEYHQFMTLLFSILCQLSGTDPREVSMGSYTDVTGKKSLFEESGDGVIKESRDGGLRTFLNFMEDNLNTPDKNGDNIFRLITKMDVRLTFTGLEIEDKTKKMEMVVKELSTTKSINELLTAEDKQSRELMLGDVNVYEIPAFGNPQVFQTVLFNAQQKAQKEAQGQQQQMMMQQQQQQQQAGAGQGASLEQQPAPEQGQEEELSDKDKEILAKYQDDESVNIDEDILSQLQGAE